MRIKSLFLTLITISLFLGTSASPAGEGITLENVVSPGPNCADEPFAEKFSMQQAVRFLDSAALTWQKQRKCFSCHSNYVFLMARPAVTHEVTAHRQIRKAADFLATHPRKTFYQATESVMVASVLAQNDAATTGKLHPATRQALDQMWEHQRDDGGWKWLDDNEPPSEIEEHYGVTMAAIGAGIAPDNYSRTPKAERGLERIRAYLKKNPPANMHNRAMKMLASLYVDGIMTKAQRQQVIDELFAIQKSDGGWNLATLGRNWKRADGTPQDYDTSDGYGTGFAIYALRTAGVSADDWRIQKGTRWLKTHQRVSGRWFTRSMDKDSQQFIIHSGTAYAILALAACGEPAPSTPPEPYEGAPVVSERPPAAQASSVGPITPDEPLRKEYSLKAAAQYLDRAATTWQRQKNCFACHTDYVYLIARPAIPRGLATHKAIRSALEERVDDPRVKKPSPYQNSEAVMVAAVLALNDAATTGKLHPLTRKALDRMWTLQREDGGWTWQKGNKPPSGIDDYFGVAMAAIGAGAAPGDYSKTPLAAEGIDRLREYFRNNPPANIHNRAILLWASTYIDGLLTAAEHEQTIRALFALQKADGGWGLATLGKWKRSDDKEQDYDSSDGYGTGFVIYVLRLAGVPADDVRIQKGIAWLKKNQRASGRWFTRSAHKDSNYITNAGTAFALLALAECGEADEFR
ncbi:MAG: hypothetical protein ACYTDV_02555 [Planctomycetota bacterium]|jgi:squalene-hopene/tetraprenyl-beta-curcumene cyclase